MKQARWAGRVWKVGGTQGTGRGGGGTAGLSSAGRGGTRPCRGPGTKRGLHLPEDPRRGHGPASPASVPSVGPSAAQERLARRAAKPLLPAALASPCNRRPLLDPGPGTPDPVRPAPAAEPREPLPAAGPGLGLRPQSRLHGPRGRPPVVTKAAAL